MDPRLGLGRLQEKVIRCRRCPRLVQYLGQIRQTHSDWWCHPVPSFGDPKARILLVGLAPGRSGSNRTGRMFTGDASGAFLYPALYTLGLATRPSWNLKHSLFWPHLSQDHLRLQGTYITAVIRCVPPANKPLPMEMENCRPFLQAEWDLLTSVRVVVALGRIAHEGFLKSQGIRGSLFPFRHAAVHRLPVRASHSRVSSTFPGASPLFLVDTYHPSRQNTQTGRLTMKMFLKVLRKAKRLAEL